MPGEVWIQTAQALEIVPGMGDWVTREHAQGGTPLGQHESMFGGRDLQVS